MKLTKTSNKPANHVRYILMKQLHCHLIDLTCIPDIKISLSSGYLESFALSDPYIREGVRFQKHCYYIGRPIDEIIASFFNEMENNGEIPDIIGFTIYFWNKNLSCLFAQRVKQRYPSVIIIFGGNDVTNQGTSLLAEEPYINIVCNGEGEQVFSNILRQQLAFQGNMQEVRGVTFRNEANEIITNPDEDRISDLGSIPSPFLTGVFSAADIFESQIIVYEFSRGCPFKCSFCYWGAAVNTRVRRFPMERIESDLVFILKHMKENSTLFLADANFGMVKADIDIARLLTSILNRYDKTIFLFANWAKNTSRSVVETAKVLFEGRLISAVTLSAQSLNEQALQYANRKNIPFKYYKELQVEFKKLGIPTYTELLLGLPGESYQSFIQGIDNILMSGGHPVVYPLLLLNNTDYATPESREKFGMKTRLTPYQMFNDYAKVEVVIEHAELSYEEWLRALGISLTMAVFGHGVLKFVILKMHQHYRITFSQMLECIYERLMNGHLLHGAMIQKVFQNYVQSLEDYHLFDKKLIGEILGEEFIQDNVHYQAAMKLILSDDFQASVFIESITEAIADKFVPEEDRDEALISEWIKTQSIIVNGLRQITASTMASTAPDLQPNGSTYVLPSVNGHDSPLELDLKTEFSSSRFDTFLLGIYHGSVDTLRLFSYQLKPYDFREYHAD